MRFANNHKRVDEPALVERHGGSTCRSSAPPPPPKQIYFLSSTMLEEEELPVLPLPSEYRIKGASASPGLDRVEGTKS